MGPLLISKWGGGVPAPLLLRPWLSRSNGVDLRIIQLLPNGLLAPRLVSRLTQARGKKPFSGQKYVKLSFIWNYFEEWVYWKYSIHWAEDNSQLQFSWNDRYYKSRQNYQKYSVLRWASCPHVTQSVKSSWGKEVPEGVSPREIFGWGKLRTCSRRGDGGVGFQVVRTPPPFSRKLQWKLYKNR